MKKIMKQKWIWGMTGFLIIVILFCFTRCMPVFTKWRMQMYLATHYNEYELKMDNFAYQDPEASGFGKGNGFYTADISAIDYEQEPDLHFSIFTDGFFLNITDNYEYQINQRETVLDRLLKEYQQDLNKISRSYFANYQMEVEVSMTGLQEDKEQQKLALNLHEPYERSLDQRLSLLITIPITRNDDDVSKLCEQIKEYDEMLEEKGFTPSAYHYKLYDNDQVSDISNLSREVIKSNDFLQRMKEAKENQQIGNYPEIGYVTQENMD